MVGRPRAFEAEELIDRAIEVFWQKGYDTSSAKDLLSALEIGQGSFYLTFKGGKRELFEKALLRFSEKALKKFDEDWQQAADPIEFVKNFFRALADAPEERKLKGCFLGNTIVELSTLDTGLKDTASRLLEKLETRFTKIIKQAQQEGRLANQTDPEILAKHLINLWNGINVTQRFDTNSQNIRAIIEMNLEVLN